MCLWLSGALEEGDRPDRLGAVLDLVSDGALPRLRVHEAAPGVYARSPRLQAIVAHYRASLPVRITSALRPLDPEAEVRELFPDGSERSIAGDQVTERSADGEMRSWRLGFSLRVARRLRDRVRRLRLRGYR
jgi:hypothetical protein